MAGSILLSLALLLSIASLALYTLTFRGRNELLNYARIAYHGMTMLVIIASAFFLYILLTHQYQYNYVYNYSSDNLSLGFLISTFWAGQEGSFMLWLLLTSIVGIFLQSYTSKRGDLEFSVMAVFTLTTTFLIAMVSPFLKNPFAYIYSEPVFLDLKNLNQSLLNNPAIQGFIYSDSGTGQNFFQINPDSFEKLKAAGIALNEFIVHGKGLNPVLQNFWMQIHPPILFAGFAMSTVPFAFAVSALMKNDYRDWVRQSFPWILAGAGILGLGIMLGGYWAYGILGWGGYWAWDPVENSSLVPWLVSVAVLHTMIVQRKSQNKGEATGRFARTNLILCVLIYILVIYSTFLTRSGILGDSSVHAFVNPGMHVYIFLLVFIVVFIALAFGMLIYRWKSFEEYIPQDENVLSRELALFTSAVVIGASALIVISGTSAPIFKQIVEPSFYNKMHVPLAIIIGLLNGLSLAIKWKNSTLGEIWQKSRISLIISLVITMGIILLGGVYDLMMILLAFASLFTIAINFDVAYRVFQGKKLMIGPYVAHIGIAVFILGVIGSSAYSVEQNVDLVKGEKAAVLGYDMTFTGYKLIENDTKYAFNIKIDKNGSVQDVFPVMYISDYTNGLVREPDLVSGLFRDIYISPQGYDDGSQKRSEGSQVTVTPGEETAVLGAKIKYQEFVKPDMAVMTAGGDFSMGAKLQIEKDGKTFVKEVLMKKRGNSMEFPPVEFSEAGVIARLIKIDPMSKQAILEIADMKTGMQSRPLREVLTVIASIKPFINLVWIGVLLLVAGFAISTVRRLKETLA